MDGIKVVDEYGMPLSMVIRRPATWANVVLPASFPGLFWILFDKQRQGWHDKIAGRL